MTNVDGGVVGLDSPVLWLDDMVTSFLSMHRALEKTGLSIDTEIRSPSILGMDVVNSYNRLILDSKFSDEDWHEGANLAKEMLNQNNKRVILFSGFIDAEKRSKVVEANNESESAVLYLPKVSVESDKVQKYIHATTQCIFDFFNCRFDQISSIDVPDFAEDYSPHSPLGFDEFGHLSLREKRFVYDEFVVNVDKKPSEYFADGAIWVFFAGFSLEPFKVAYEKDEILSVEEVNAICSDLDCPPFIFRNDVVVSTTGCATNFENCATGDQISSYPVAGLCFATGRLQGPAFTEIHFDTGADFSFLCEKFVSDNDIESSLIGHLGELLLHGEKHLCDLRNIQVVLRGLKRGRAGVPRIPHEMKTVVIEAWDRSGLRVSCSNGCKLQGKGSDCLFRKNGLLGRTAYIDFDGESRKSFDFFLDSKDSRVYFVNEKFLED